MREIRYTSRREDVSTETGTSTSCFGDNDFDCTPMSIKATLVGFSVTCVSFIIEASLKRLTVLLFNPLLPGFLGTTAMSGLRLRLELMSLTNGAQNIS